MDIKQARIMASDKCSQYNHFRTSMHPSLKLQGYFHYLEFLAERGQAGDIPNRNYTATQTKRALVMMDDLRETTVEIAYKKPEGQSSIETLLIIAEGLKPNNSYRILILDDGMLAGIKQRIEARSIKQRLLGDESKETLIDCLLEDALCFDQLSSSQLLSALPEIESKSDDNGKIQFNGYIPRGTKGLTNNANLVILDISQP